MDLDGRLPSSPPLSPDYVEITILLIEVDCPVSPVVDELNMIAESLSDSDLQWLTDRLNTDYNRVFSGDVDYFRGQRVEWIPDMGGAASTHGTILFPENSTNSTLLIHESAHFHGQAIPLGHTTYMRYVGFPSLISSGGSGPIFGYASLLMRIFYGNAFANEMLAIFDGTEHYEMPWEVFADIVGGISMREDRRGHSILCRSRALWYHEILQMKSPEHPTPLDQDLIDLIMREFRGVDEIACP